MTTVPRNDEASETPGIPPALVLTAAVFAVSTGAIFARMAGEAHPLVISAYRVGLAVLVISPFVLIRCRRELAAISRSDLKFAGLAGLFLALHFATWISSLSYTSVACSVMLVNTTPLWVGLLTPLVTGEPVGSNQKKAIIMSVIGGLIIGWGDIATGPRALFGDFLALCGSVSAAVYILLGRRVRSRLSLPAYIFLCYGMAALALWVVVLSSGLVLPGGLRISGFAPKTVMMFWAMALIPQLIGHTGYNWSLKYCPPPVIAVSLLGEPVGAALLALWLFGEPLTIFFLIGGALILYAVYLTSRNTEN